MMIKKTTGLILLVFVVNLTTFHPEVYAVVYQYDQLNRLTRVVYDANTSIEYTYDAAGNMTRKLVIQPPNPDTDLSGTVDFIDFAKLAEDWLETVDHKKGDLNRDGKVDIYDLAIMADYWLQPGEVF